MFTSSQPHAKYLLCAAVKQPNRLLVHSRTSVQIPLLVSGLLLISTTFADGKASSINKDAKDGIEFRFYCTNRLEFS